MDKQTMLWPAIKQYGLAWSSARLVYELQVRSGLQTLRFGQRSWSEDELSQWISSGVVADADGYLEYWRRNRQPFFFLPAARLQYARALGQILGESGVETLTGDADRLREGCFTYFSSQTAELGFPPDWHLNPFTGQHTSPSDHWSNIPMFSGETGDLKFIWEPGRFAFAYTLARAYWATGDETYPETFWQLMESWASENPPNHGAHWKCGQETSLRLMAWCFALYAFADSAATTAPRLALLVGTIAAQADRVAGDHAYARLQRNNHSVSEGAGLWTVGLLFPELRRARQWRTQGREILIRETTQQIASDGSYIQNSTNYHRLMLQDYIWAIRLGEVCGDPIADSVLQRIGAAVAFLFQVQDSESGQVPCYGHNDGALVLPLNACDYADFRPVISAGNYLVNRNRLYEAGLWDEDLLWLFGPEAPEAPERAVRRASFAAPEGGYYTLRGERSFGFTRCGTYHYRPAQADMLHLDLWWRGVNVVCDPGSYLYYADPPWDNSLKDTSVHSTVMVAAQNQMIAGPRFMWFNWVKSEVLSVEGSADGNVEWFQGQHGGYLRLKPPVIHRRGVVRAGDNVWVVVDDLLGNGAQWIEGHWLLHPGEHHLADGGERLRLSLPGGDLQLYWKAWGLGETSVDSTCGEESRAPRGWRSRYYGVREPALSLKVGGLGQLPCRVVWVFVLGETTQKVLFDRERVEVRIGNEQTLSVALSAPGLADRVSLKEVSFTHDSRIETLKA